MLEFSIKLRGYHFKRNLTPLTIFISFNLIDPIKCIYDLQLDNFEKFGLDSLAKKFPEQAEASDAITVLKQLGIHFSVLLPIYYLDFFTAHSKVQAQRLKSELQERFLHGRRTKITLNKVNKLEKQSICLINSLKDFTEDSSTSDSPKSIL